MCLQKKLSAELYQKFAELERTCGMTIQDSLGVDISKGVAHSVRDVAVEAVGDIAKEIQDLKVKVKKAKVNEDFELGYSSAIGKVLELLVGSSCPLDESIKCEKSCIEKGSSPSTSKEAKK